MKGCSAAARRLRAMREQSGGRRSSSVSVKCLLCRCVRLFSAVSVSSQWRAQRSGNSGRPLLLAASYRCRCRTGIMFLIICAVQQACQDENPQDEVARSELNMKVAGCPAGAHPGVSVCCWLPGGSPNGRLPHQCGPAPIRQASHHDWCASAHRCRGHPISQLTSLPWASNLPAQSSCVLSIRGVGHR